MIIINDDDYGNHGKFLRFSTIPLREFRSSPWLDNPKGIFKNSSLKAFRRKYPFKVFP